MSVIPARGTKREHDVGFGAGPVYWNKKYKEEPYPFEWLRGYEDLNVKRIIHEVTQGEHQAEILHTGCGNSLLPEDMYDAGYKSIVNIDSSLVCIRQMLQRNRMRPGMSWLEMDCTDMTFEDSSFDVVIEKFVMDAMACGNNAPLVIGTYLKEVQRVLRPGGRFVCITYGSPDSRLEYFSQRHLEFSMRHEELSAPSGRSTHWVYICTKPQIMGQPPVSGQRSRRSLRFLTTSFSYR